MRLFFFFIIVLSIIGCSLPQEYDVSIKNVGNDVIYDAHVFYGDFRSVGGVIPPGIRSVHMKPGHPIPEKAIVQWRSKDNVLKEKQVFIKKLTPKDFDGEIRFEIGNDNNVEILFID